MTHQYVFDYVHNQWTWHCVDDKKRVIKRSKETFTYYLDCLENAKADGLAGAPLFRKPDGALAVATRLQP